MLLFFACLIICIMWHEAGHLLVAKLCKCGVNVYSIGFGKPVLFKKKIGKTTYQITPWIFGGYCQLKDELKASKAKDSFSNLPYRKKFLIAIAGCSVNIIMGLIFLLLGKIFGVYELLYFGFLSTLLGITNLLPIAPCLDGGYVVYLPLFIRAWGKKKGLIYFAKAANISLKILIVLNIACIPYVIILFMRGGFNVIM